MAPSFQLPAALRDAAAVGLTGDRFVLIGGLDSADVSSSEITVADAHGVVHQGTLPLAQHDAQGALLDGRVYVFGGGSLSELDHIISFDPANGSVSTAGTLPRAQSDVAATASDGTAYIVGGYDGTTARRARSCASRGSSARAAASARDQSRGQRERQPPPSRGPCFMRADCHE